MPRFYFDVREGSHLIADDEGVAFASLELAERAAARAAADIARDCLPLGECCTVAVEVRDEDGERMLTVTVTMEIEPASSVAHLHNVSH